ncbi:MAG: HAD family hydrolase [Candidatus Entotheonellia bacterium]
MNRPDLLIFDLDGVLVDTSPCHRRAYEDLWHQLGIEGPSYETIAGRKTSEVVVELTAHLKPSAAQIREWTLFKQLQARQYLTTEAITYSDSAPCLAALARHRVRLALGTAASRATTDEDVSVGKPSPEAYLKLMARAAASPAHTVIVEDSRAGIMAAVASKAYVAVVRTGRTVHHPRFIGSFADLHGLLDKIGIVSACIAC